MGTVMMHAAVSVDGFVADENDRSARCSTTTATATPRSSRAARSRPRRSRPTTCGRKAEELAGERTVAVTAGEVGGQALALGLVDEVAMDVVPVVFGSGRRYFGSAGGLRLIEDPHTVIQGDRVLHLSYRAHR